MAGPATLPRDGRPLLVHCEHGVRSVAACHLLARAGVAGLLNMTGGLSVWRGPREFGPDQPAVAGPSPWLLENADLLPQERGRALDVACGRGRHALLLAPPVSRCGDRPGRHGRGGPAGRRGAPVPARPRAGARPGVRTPELGTAAYALVVVFHYLHRPLFPALVAAVAPGGLLLYETFTVDQAGRGVPRTRTSCSSTASSGDWWRR